MMKAPDAYRTITEVADTMGLPAHVLRFWETKFSQIRPLKRGGGRRFYRPEDIEFLKRIQHLLHEQGYTIRGVQLLLETESAAAQHTKKTPPTVASPADAPLKKETVDSLQMIRQELQEMLHTLKSAEASAIKKAPSA
jgi:DNA-binding transcriptional MerR regulator